MDADVLAALVADKLSSVALLGLGIWALWRRYTASSDKLIAALSEQTTSLVGGLAEVKAAVTSGLAGLAGRVDQHASRLDQHEQRLGEHQRKLDRHAELIAAVSGASGVYAMPPRPRVVNEEAPQ